MRTNRPASACHPGAQRAVPPQNRTVTPNRLALAKLLLTHFGRITPKAQSGVLWNPHDIYMERETIWNEKRADESTLQAAYSGQGCVTRCPGRVGPSPFTRSGQFRQGCARVSSQLHGLFPKLQDRRRGRGSQSVPASNCTCGAALEWEVPATFIYGCQRPPEPFMRTGISFNRVFDISGANECARGLWRAVLLPGRQPCRRTSTRGHVWFRA
jgi:hypothetical protein